MKSERWIGAGGRREAARRPRGILALDVDGTLTGFNEPVKERTRRAVHSAREAGWIVTIATGRSWLAAKPVADHLDLRLPIITHNGALVRDSVTGEILHYRPLPAGVVQSIVPNLVHLGLQPVVVEDIHDGDRLFAGPASRDSEPTRIWLERLERVHRTVIERVSYDELSKRGRSIRVQIFEERHRLPAIAPIVNGRERDFRVLGSADMPGTAELVQFLHPEGTKAAAIGWLAKSYELGPSDVVAVGDGINDIEMISEAGFGVAMGNAAGPVQAAAELTIGHHRDEGLAAFIEERLLAVDSVAELQSLIG